MNNIDVDGVLSAAFDTFQANLLDRFANADPTVHVHTPPKAVPVLMNILDDALTALDDTEEGDVDKDTLIELMMYAMNRAIQFGLFLEKHCDIKYSDLRQCSCFSISDKELTDLIK